MAGVQQVAEVVAGDHSERLDRRTSRVRSTRSQPTRRRPGRPRSRGPARRRCPTRRPRRPCRAGRPGRGGHRRGVTPPLPGGVPRLRRGRSVEGFLAELLGERPRRPCGPPPPAAGPPAPHPPWQHHGVLGDPGSPPPLKVTGRHPSPDQREPVAGLRGPARHAAGTHRRSSPPRRRARSIANSDTHGAPAPASGRPVSRPRSTSVAASDSSTSWAAQNSITCRSIRTSAASRSARSARTASRRATRGSPSNSCTDAAAMTPIQPATTDTRSPPDRPVDDPSGHATCGRFVAHNPHG